MKRSLKLILAICIPAVLIGGYFFLTNMQEKKEEKASQKPKDTTITLLEIEPSEVETITLARGTDTLTVVRKGKNWALAQDLPYAIQQKAVDNIGKSATSLAAFRLIAESPEDLAQYGLSEPRCTITVEKKDGSTTVGYLGNRTPSKRNYYFTKEDDPAVYTISRYHGANYLKTIDQLRERQLATVNTKKISYLKIDGERTLEITRLSREETERDLTALYSFRVLQPYRNKRGIDSTGFEELIKSLPSSVTARNFIEHDPEDLSPYGLDNPRVTLTIEDDKAGFTLRFGDTVNEDEVYAKLAGDPQVFTMSKGALDFLSYKPFSVVSKFALIVNIEKVETLTITGPEDQYVMDILREEQEGGEEEKEKEVKTTYLFNGEEVEEEVFKQLYQETIGLMIDAENPQPDYTGEDKQGEPHLRLQYDLNVAPYQVSIELFDFNTDFYALYRNGISEFLVSKSQVEKLLNTAAAFPDIEVD
jgi:hypothetical protein